MRMIGSEDTSRRPAGPGRVRPLRLLSLALASLLLLLVGGIEPARATVACDTSWVNGAGGFFDHASNWTNGVPTSTKNACITLAGSYDVRLSGDQSAAGLTLGGVSGTQTLIIDNFNGNSSLTLANQGAFSDGVGPHGVLGFQNHYINGAATLDVAGGTLMNNGSIFIEHAPSRSDQFFLTGDLVNNGTVFIDGNMDTGPGSDWTNAGAIQIHAGSSLDLAGGAAQTFTQAGGSILNDGDLRQTGGLLTFSGGSTSGNPIELSGATIAPSGGSGNILLLGKVSLSGDVGPGITLRVEGRSSGLAQLAVGANTSSGTIELASTDACCTASLATKTLTNAGTIKTSPGGHPERSISGGLINNGLLQIDNLTRTSLTSVWQNLGTIRVATGVLLDHGLGKLTNQSGTTLTGGTYELAGTFKYGRASIATNAARIVLDGAGAAIQDGAGANALAAFASNAAASSLELKNGTALTSSAAVANAGTVIVGSDSSFQSSGNYTQSAAFTVVDGNLTAAGGQVLLNGGLLSGTGTLAPALNNAAGTVAPGTSPGVLTVNGNYSQGKNATLRLELNGLTVGSQYDRLAVTGAAALNGTLQLVTGFAPSLGDGVIPLTFASRAGSFKPIQGQFISNPPDTGWLVDTNPTNVTLSLVETVDLKTTKNDSADPVTIEQSFSYTITVVNQSSRQATGVKVVDTIKSPLTLDGTPATTKGTCTVAGSPAKVTCQVGALNAGESVTITIPVEATVTGTAKNTANATTKKLDSNAANNKDTEKTTVNP